MAFPFPNIPSQVTSVEQLMSGDWNLIAVPAGAELTEGITNGPNTIDGGDGNDDINGLGGNDTINGGKGDDYLKGSNGDDLIYGGAGSDLINGGAGADDLYGGAGMDQLIGGLGADYLHGGAGSDLLKGGADNDTLSGATGDDFLYGGDGNDLLYGGSENDMLFGGDGDDRLVGGTGDNYLYGGRGADTFVWWEGDGARTVADGGMDYDTLRVELTNPELYEHLFMDGFLDAIFAAEPNEYGYFLVPNFGYVRDIERIVFMHLGSGGEFFSYDVPDIPDELLV